jgi:phosphoglycolate phosphatase
MNRYEHYLFDLDGTLTDPGVGIKNSIRYALRKFGLPIPEEAVLDTFIGPPLLDSFAIHCGASPEDARKLLTLYREYFSEKGIFENTVYEGIPETLSALKQRGAKLYLATSKPEPYAVRILEHFDLLSHFTFVGGSTMDETRTEKAEVIGYVLENNAIDVTRAVMVGDRKYDVAGGRAWGMDTVGVLFGYGSREELTNAGADIIAETVEDLKRILFMEE